MHLRSAPAAGNLLSATAAVALAVLFALPTGVALHCNGDILAVGSGSLTIYVDDRTDVPPEYGIWNEADRWVYLETNGVEGLQTGGEIIDCNLGDPWVFCLSDGCHHHDPDQLIW